MSEVFLLPLFFFCQSQLILEMLGRSWVAHGNIHPLVGLRVKWKKEEFMYFSELYCVGFPQFSLLLSPRDSLAYTYFAVFFILQVDE